MKLDRQLISVSVVAFCLGAVAAFVALTLSQRTRPLPIVILPPEPTPTAEPTATPGPIWVEVAGAVVAPGVYALPAGGRVEDALAAAGGVLASAEADPLNLAQVLSDGMQVVVPKAGEVGTVDNLLVDSSRAASIDLGEVGLEEGGSGGLLINLNRATVADLDELPGIGPSTAEKIVAYREQNGPFESLEQLLLVSGIGDAKLEQVRAFITVAP